MEGKLALCLVKMTLMIFVPTVIAFITSSSLNGGRIQHEQVGRKLSSSSISGFISIDCGATKDYIDEFMNIPYQSDAAFINTGTNSQIANSIRTQTNPMKYMISLRSFPQGVKNCYALKPEQGKDNKYMIRASFMYGNYDGKNEPPIFDLYLGVNLWNTVQLMNASQSLGYEIIFTSTTEVIYVCLVNTGSGVPFISALELRHLNNSIYQNGLGALETICRRDIGNSGQTIRYPNDVYDRLWNPMPMATFPAGWIPISTPNNIDIQNITDAYKIPAQVLMTAIQTQNSSSPLTFFCTPFDPSDDCFVYLHFAEIQKLNQGQQRELIISLNGGRPYVSIFLDYLKPVTVIPPDTPIRGARVYFSIYANESSNLPPILNAFEVFRVKELPLLPTNAQDVETMMDIKRTYNVTKDWEGDPCVPSNYAWEGLNCSADNLPKIISLNLSSSKMAGTIAPSFVNLTSIESLDLSYNDLTGAVPEFLAQMSSLKVLNLTGNKLTGCLPQSLVEKSKNGTLLLSVEVDPNFCMTAARKTHKKSKKLLLPVIIPVSIVVLISGSLVVIWMFKRNGQEEHKNEDTLVTPKKQQFTYSEVTDITNNFANVIGEGGFGLVYSGTLDGKAVAVKMQKPSKQGIKEIQSEVEVLTKCYHKNLVKLVGYCDEGPNKALIYEYIENGSLKNHLSATNSNVLSWRERLQIALDAARGLNYLHNDCIPPIIHRDLKPENILLGENLQAKISDFGLSREFPTEIASYVLTDLAGTTGYFDPEIQMTGKFTKGTDIYSFGIIIMELITGKAVIFQDSSIDDDPLWINILQWMKPRYDSGDVSKYVDPNLALNFNSNSVTLAADIAMKCTRPTSQSRPDVLDVIKELEDCLVLEVEQGSSRGPMNRRTV